MGCDVPGVLMLDIVQRDSLNRMGSGIRGDSVRNRLHVLRESRKMSVIVINKLVAEEELISSLGLLIRMGLW